MNEATLRFAREHADDDVRQLALRGRSEPDVDLTAALQQIAGRQTALRKLPTWVAVEDILYPPHLNMEQCSSEATARYKAELLCTMLTAEERSSSTLVDLTGGLGVDFAFMAPHVGRSVYIEHDETLCHLARHNMPLLGLPHARILCAEAQQGCGIAENIGKSTEEDGDGQPSGTVFYMDPARRDTAGRRTYALCDCTPNVLTLLPQLMSACRLLLLKLSPMLDWHKAVADLESAATDCRVREVHVVAVGGECKELLVVVEKGRGNTALRVVCAEDDTRFTFLADKAAAPPPVTDTHILPSPGQVLLVPGAAVMKSGGFGPLAMHYGVRQLGQNSHLFVADSTPAAWPGRTFHITAVTSLNKQEIRSVANGAAPLRANISVRNFPMTADELRKRLQAKDGGDVFVFATTLPPRRHVLIWCRKTYYPSVSV